MRVSWWARKEILGWRVGDFESVVVVVVGDDVGCSDTVVGDTVVGVVVVGIVGCRCEHNNTSTSTTHSMRGAYMVLS